MMGLVTPVPPVPLDQLGAVHFVAIGGAGMSGVARIMLARGVPVSGCDSAASAQLDELASLGARVCVGHSPEHLAQADTLVISSAIRQDNPELVAARALGLRVLHRAAALASVMLDRRSIAIAGTHGKTTTTSMVTTTLRRCGADPAYVIGGVLAETGVGAADGSGSWFVAEADESDGSFLMLAPEAAIVTCVEADHLDNYGSLEQIQQAFVDFAGKIRPGGLLVLDSDDKGTRLLDTMVKAISLPVRVVSYGDAVAADYQLTQIRPVGMSTECVVVHDGTPVTLSLAVPGRHNARNAAAAFALAVELGFEPEAVAAGLASYQGAMRRMEPKGEVGGVLVLDSYAHHPTELGVDLAAARDIVAGGRVVAIFQPHLFSRTRIFADQFAAALDQADEIFVLDVYAAREDPEPGVTGALITDAIPGERARFWPDAATLPAAIADLARPGDVVLTMGAGDVTRLGPQIVAALAARSDSEPSPDGGRR